MAGREGEGRLRVEARVGFGTLEVGPGLPVRWVAPVLLILIGVIGLFLTRGGTDGG